VRGIGQHRDSDEVSHLRRRIYQDADTSTAKVTAVISSGRPLATEGGHVSVRNVDKETPLLPVGNPTEAPASAALVAAEEGHNDIRSEDQITKPTGELTPSQACVPLPDVLSPPRRSYEMLTSRDRQRRDSDEAPRRRIYQDADTSTAKLPVTISPASGRLLASEEGHIGIHRVDKETPLLPVGNPTEAPASAVLLAAEEGRDGIRSEDRVTPPDLSIGNPMAPSQARAPLAGAMPHRPYEMLTSRDHTQLCPHGPFPEAMYRGDARLYESMPYHLGPNPSWYNPPSRGPDVHYRPYHPFILPPPFASHYAAMYGNDKSYSDPTLHARPGTFGRGHYANIPPPFRAQHANEYAEPSGSHERPPGAYREHHYLTSSGADPGPSTRDGANHSAKPTEGDTNAEPFDQHAREIADTRDA